MDTPLRQYAYVTAFRCIGPDCPDSCCVGWDMPSDSRQQALCAAHAPELLAAIDPDTRTILRSPTGDCSQLDRGLCRIHARYGSDFLSDSCHFYPRILRDNDAGACMSANLSCPEIARLVLESPDPFALAEATLERMPLRIPHVGEPNAAAISGACLGYALDPRRRPAEALARFIAIGDAAVETWPEMLENELPTQPDIATDADTYRVLYALVLVMALSGSSQRPRLESVVAVMLERLRASVDGQGRELTLLPGAIDACRQLRTEATSQAASIDAILRRWLAAQFTMWGFPFGGYPSLSLAERLRILSVRFAIVRLALQCHLHTQTPAADIVQPVSRLLDHIGDPALILDICRDAGWSSPARLQALALGA